MQERYFAPTSSEDLLLSRAMKADRAMERAEAQGRKRNAAAIRETLTEADFEEFRARGGNRFAAREMAKERGLKTGQLYKALAGRNF